MVVGKTMIVAGIGSKKGVSAREVLAAIELALDAHGLAMSALSALATTAFKRDEEAILAAGRELGLPVMVVEGGGKIPPPSIPPLKGEGVVSVAPHHHPPSPSRLRLDTSPPLREGEDERQALRHPLPASGGEVVSAAKRRGGRDNPTVPHASASLTHSDLSLAVAGTPSVSETAALAAAGEGARLAGPRLAVGNVTCAIAFGGDDA